MLLEDRIKKLGGYFFRHRAMAWLVLIPILAVVLVLEMDDFLSRFSNKYLDSLYEVPCLAVALIGEAIRILTIGFIPKGTSGRNTSSHEKASVLNTTGMYSIVRNPLYLGNYVILLGISLLFRTWEVPVMTSMFFALLYVPVIVVEEKFLGEKFGESFAAYASTVPCFLPKISLWKRPELAWSWRMVIRREHDSIYSVIVTFVVIVQIRAVLLALYGGQAPQPDVPWLLFGAVGTAAWLTAEVLKKFTKVLRTRPTSAVAANPDDAAVKP